MSYLLDTNVISDLIKGQVFVLAHLAEAKQRGETLYLSTPVDYEVQRGIAALWGATFQKGRQLSEVDLLIVAMTRRLEAVLVTADNDFEAIENLSRVNWRAPLTPQT